MFFWFIGTALVTMWFVFHDPAIDLRMVVAGALAPDVLDAPFGGARIAHSVTFAVAVLTAVMLGTIGRRLLRRRLVMVAVGLMLHLVFDGVVSSTKVFWWPIGGDAWPDARLPVIERGLWNVPLEIAGLIMCGWAWKTFGWQDRSRRELLRRTGRLDRSFVGR
ncbi:MAG: hypothetical protein AB7N61_22155 [Acidimicrobiia bacterium]